jgi:hypothetical protein
MTANAPLTWGLANAIEDGSAEPIDWIDVSCPELDLVLTVPRLPLRCSIEGRMMVASVNYREQVRICRLLGCVSPTSAMYQALWKASTVKIPPHPLVFIAADAAQMGTLAFLTKANDLWEAELANHAAELAADGAFARGYWKCWEVGSLMMEQGPNGAENEGYEYPNGRELQNPGGRHNDRHLDDSQACEDLPKREARRISDGSLVDLLELERTQFPALRARLTLEYGP